MVKKAPVSGLESVMDYTARFDRLEAASVVDLEVTDDEIDEAFARCGSEDIDALKLAVERVARFHEKQKQQTWLSTEEPDIMLGQKVTPLARVSPAGKLMVDVEGWSPLVRLGATAT